MENFKTKNKIMRFFANETAIIEEDYIIGDDTKV
tara:strand:+ start:545 stop:646 length:102 start_codon:yes stop_codon:yes gene_type:complete